MLERIHCNMPFFFQLVRSFSRENTKQKFKFSFHMPIQPTERHGYILIPHRRVSSLGPVHNLDTKFHFHDRNETFRFIHLNVNQIGETQQYPDDELAIKVQNILKFRREKSQQEIERALDQSDLRLTEDLVLNILRRHRSDWKPAYIFFNWVRNEGKIPLGSNVYNEILNILGKMWRFEELIQVFDEMSKRDGHVDEETYRIVINRYAAAHKVEEAIDVFNKRKDLGLALDLVAFQKLLMCLCRYKHVETAETLLHSKMAEFGLDIKAMNIVLNGWCVLGNVHEAKRFWKDIISSKCKPDLFTYATFINALTKKGKLGTAMKLFRAMWEEGSCKPDVVICNCVIDALCFKKRVPQALEVFQEMNERGRLPNVATYNALIKHLCKIRRMEKVYELLDEMELKGGGCSPNDITFNYLLKSLKKAEEIPGLLERMERNGCKMTGDTYNLVLKLYMALDDEERVRHTWYEMEKSGLGPDRRSYTIMIHGFYDKGKTRDALRYFGEMTSKGMVPEQRTEMLVNAMNNKSKVGRGEPGTTKGANNDDKSTRPIGKRKRKAKARHERSSTQVSYTEFHSYAV